MQLKERLVHHDVPGIQREVVGAYLFALYNKSYLCVVYYHSKFPLIKEREVLSADNIIVAYEVIFLNYPRK